MKASRAQVLMIGTLVTLEQEGHPYDASVAAHGLRAAVAEQPELADVVEQARELARSRKAMLEDDATNDPVRSFVGGIGEVARRGEGAVRGIADFVGYLGKLGNPNGGAPRKR